MPWTRSKFCRSKEKAEDLKLCKDKLNFRKHHSKILTCSISGQRATNHQPAKAILKVTREDWTYTTHYHTKRDVFWCYEWLEIREAIRKVKSAYKKLIEGKLDSLLSRMSKIIKFPSLQPAQRRKSVAAEGPTLRNEPSVKFSAEEILFKKWQVDLSMLSLLLPAYRPMPSGIIIMDPEHGVYT